MRGGLSEKAHSWISFRTEKSDLAPFPDVCCILLHPKHIAAVLKASIFGVHFVVAYRNIRPPITKELSWATNSDNLNLAMDNLVTYLVTTVTKMVIIDQ